MKNTLIFSFFFLFGYTSVSCQFQRIEIKDDTPTNRPKYMKTQVLKKMPEKEFKLDSSNEYFYSLETKIDSLFSTIRNGTVSKTYFTRTDKGSVEKKHDYGKNSKISKSETITNFDTVGRITSKVSIRKGDTTSVEIRHLNDEGLLVCIERLNQNGKKSVTKKHYDSFLHPIYDLRYSIGKDETNSSENKRGISCGDTKGILPDTLSRREYEQSGDTLITAYYNKRKILTGAEKCLVKNGVENCAATIYNRDGSIGYIQRSITYSDSLVYQIDQYNESIIIENITSTDSKSGFDFTIRKAPDFEPEIKIKMVYKYEYDKKGNIVLREGINTEGVVTEKIVREITYY